MLQWIGKRKLKTEAHAAALGGNEMQCKAGTSLGLLRVNLWKQIRQAGGEQRSLQGRSRRCRVLAAAARGGRSETEGLSGCDRLHIMSWNRPVLLGWGG